MSLPRAGEKENGDVAVVRHDGARSLLAVVDALGHGPHAAHAARIAASYLLTQAFPSRVIDAIDGLHACLRGTRGAAAMVCITSPGRLEACGVGNVELRCSRPRVPVVLTPGVMGGLLKQPKIFSSDLQPNDRIVIFSDGVSSRFSLNDVRDLSPEDACRTIFAQCRRAHDDATVLVADLGS
jgi:negative regulator of sigma-B (phosphoserine phosphatase)